MQLMWYNSHDAKGIMTLTVGKTICTGFFRSVVTKKATRIGACANFGGNFEWGITRMRGFSSLFCDNGPEKPCKSLHPCDFRGAQEQRARVLSAENNH